jgi:hypothetical protein
VGFKGASINRRNELFFPRGLDDPNQFEFARQIEFYVTVNFGACGPDAGAIAAPDLAVGQISGPAAR